MKFGDRIETRAIRLGAAALSWLVYLTLMSAARGSDNLAGLVVVLPVAMTTICLGARAGLLGVAAAVFIHHAFFPEEELTEADVLVDIVPWLALVGLSMLVGYVQTRAETLGREAALSAAMLRAQGELGEAVVVMRVEGNQARPLRFNEGLSALTGYSREELERIDSLGDLLRGESRLTLTREPGTVQEALIERKDGELRALEISYTRFGEDRDGTLLAVARDVTERKRALEDAESARARIHLLLHGTPCVIFSSDLSGRTTFMSENVSEVLGVEPAIMLRDREWLRRVHPDDRSRIEREIPRKQQALGSVPSEFRMLRADGTYRWIHSEVRVRRDASGAPVELIGFFFDVTDRKNAEEELQRQAARDRTTGLPSRAVLRERLVAALSRPETRQLALANVDIDRFDDVNDAFGLAVGDEVLASVGARLRDQLTSTELVARLHGDKFSVMVPGVDAAGAYELGRRLLRTFERPFDVAGQQLVVTASVGIALAPTHATEADALLRDADLALYEAKKARETFAVYAPERDHNIQARLALLTDLRHAVERNEFTLHYQPVIEAATGKTTHFEALIRWRHPERGMVPPNDFIPLAEQTGLMKSITEWVIDEALRQCWAWRELGMNVGVAVNLSPRNLNDPELSLVIRRGLDRYGVGAAALTVEITESVVMADPDRAQENLARLRAMGVRIAVDDFGTGYSSLAYLNRLPIDTIKIDRSFVKQVVTDENSAAIVRATTDLGHTLGFGVVAEGVETSDILHLVAAFGCDAAQGYHIARPMPASEVERWYASAAARTEAAPPASDRKRILVIDDQDVIRLTAQLLLSRQGYDVAQAATAEDALRIVRDGGRVDLVLADVVLPGLRAPEFARVLHAERPELPVLFMSGFPTASLPDVPAGATLLAKPFTERALGDAVRGALAGARVLN
jgi:diguanylate cyclase (GGDEF)-like protein/PAS domain S-box-containing protein